MNYVVADIENTKNIDDKGTIRLDGAIFPDGRIFEGHHFRRSVSFWDATFLGDVTSFKNARFIGPYFETSFYGAKFLSPLTTFNFSEFHTHGVNFTLARFDGSQVTFENATFGSGWTSFKWVRFSKGPVGAARFEPGVEVL